MPAMPVFAGDARLPHQLLDFTHLVFVAVAQRIEEVAQLLHVVKRLLRLPRLLLQLLQPQLGHLQQLPQLSVVLLRRRRPFLHARRLRAQARHLLQERRRRQTRLLPAPPVQRRRRRRRTRVDDAGGGCGRPPHLLVREGDGALLVRLAVAVGGEGRRRVVRLVDLVRPVVEQPHLPPPPQRLDARRRFRTRVAAAEPHLVENAAAAGAAVCAAAPARQGNVGIIVGAHLPDLPLHQYQFDVVARRDGFPADDVDGTAVVVVVIVVVKRRRRRGGRRRLLAGIGCRLRRVARDVLRHRSHDDVVLLPQLRKVRLAVRVVGRLLGLLLLGRCVRLGDRVVVHEGERLLSTLGLRLAAATAAGRSFALGVIAERELALGRLGALLFLVSFLLGHRHRVCVRLQPNEVQIL
eukprot:Rhum_TRINITY_DN15264_c6_g2::Rhum_TRINITY_DN15264_c6_g2_i1::g.149192::m.149192